MVRPWMVSQLVLVQLGGCTGAGTELPPSPAKVVDGSTLAAVEVLSGAGSSPYRATIRGINAWGASVTTDTVTVTIDGSERTVQLDALGYGGAVIDSRGDHTATVGSGEPVPLYVYPVDWPGVGGSLAFVPPVPDAAEVYGVTGGIVGRSGPDLWFVGDDMPAHRVLHADADLLGARAVNVDVDGRLDLVAWTTSQVFVLRGHTGGGFGWGTSFQAQGLTVASVDVGDLTGDNLPDIAIAWVGGQGGGILDVWEAVGVFRFEGSAPRNIPGKPKSVIVADHNADGIAQVTVLHDDGTWSRFLQGAERQYIPVGPTTPPSLILPRDSTLEACGDINGDAAAELVVASPEPSSFWLLDIDTDPQECEAGLVNAQCLTEYVLLDDLADGDLACADLDSDSVDELWAWDDGVGLRVYQNDEYTNQLRSQAIAFPFGTGAFAVSDRDGDGIAEPVIGGNDAWSQRLGAPPLESEGIWSPRSELTVEIRETVVGGFVPLEADGDPDTFEWAAFETAPSGTLFRVLQYVPFTGNASSIGSLRLDDDGAVPDDLAVCGDNVYVALAGQVTQVSLRVPTEPSLGPTSGEGIVRVACGTGPAGTSVVTVTEDGVAETWSAALNGGRAEQGTFGDAAFADLGAGPVVVGCPTPGCGVALWNFGSDTAVVAGDAAGVSFSVGGGAAEAASGRGVPFVTHVDGDEREDLVVWDRDRRRMTVYRSTGDGIAPPELMDLAGDYSRLEFADIDLDGVPDLVGLDGAGRLSHTVLSLPPTTGGT